MSIPDDLEPRLRDLLHGVAAGVDSPDLDQSNLERVRRRGRRRRNAGRGLVATCSVLAVVAVGLVSVRVIGNQGDEGFAVSGPEPTAAPTTDSDEPTSTDEPADGEPSTAVPTTVVGDTIDGGMTMGDDAGWGAYNGFDSPVVVWGDGFARVGVVYDSPKIGPLSDEVVALFPPEVVEFFEGRMPTTIDEGLAMLEDRSDLLTEIQRVIADHPEAAQALQGAPTNGRVVVETSPDGQVWETAGTLELPAEMTYFSSVASTGDRLVVAGQTWTDDDENVRGSTGVAVASTSDLATWDVVQLLEPALDIEAPIGVRREMYVNSLDIGPAGVVLGLIESFEFEFESLLPAEVRAELESGASYSTSTGSNSITVEVFGNARETTVVGSDGTEEFIWDEGEATARYSFTFEELGVDASALEPSPSTTTVWIGAPGAELVRAAPLDIQSWWSLALATSDGGVALAAGGDRGTAVWYSADGTSWSDRTPPLDADTWPSAFVRAGDGVLLIVDSDDGLQLWRGDASAQGWTQVDEPDFGPEGFGWTMLSSAGPSGTAVLYAYEPGPRPPGYDSGEFTIERDGYRFEYEFSRFEASARLVRIGVGVDGSDDELVHAWGLDFWNAPEHVDQLSDGGLTFRDPTSGEELMTVTSDDFEQAYEDAFGDDLDFQMFTPPGHVLMWTVDGSTWVELDRLDPGEPRDMDGFGEVPEVWPSALVSADGLVLAVFDGGESGTDIRTYTP